MISRQCINVFVESPPLGRRTRVSSLRLIITTDID